MATGAGIGFFTAEAEPGPRSLDHVRLYLKTRDFKAAEELIQQILKKEKHHPEAWIVFGLVHFQTNRFQSALEAFDRALSLLRRPASLRGARPPGETLSAQEGLVHFNRGSCLFQLERFSEAERAFVLASQRDEEMAPLATVNAAFSALEQGAWGRAEEHRHRAAALLEKMPEMAQVLRDLELEIASERASGPPPGQKRPLRPDSAAALPSAKGKDSAIPTSASTVSAQDPSTEVSARALLADHFLQGFWGAMELGGGYDSNVAQSSMTAPSAGTSQSALQDAWFGTLSLALGSGHALGERVALLWDYAFEQLAYGAEELDNYNLQLHALSLSHLVALRRWLRLGISANGSMAFHGLSTYSALIWDIGARLFSEADLRQTITLGLLFDFTRTEAIDQAYPFLTANRYSLMLWAQGKWNRLSLKGSFRYRNDRQGEQQLDAGVLGEIRGGNPIIGCALGCQGTYRIPLAYQGMATLGNLSWNIIGAFSLDLEAALEWRRYQKASALMLQPTIREPFSLSIARREDVRLSGQMALRYSLGEHFDLGFGYELMRNFSNIQPSDSDPAHQWDYDDLNYISHQVTLSLGAEI
jgi:hypothetical protein